MAKHFQGHNRPSPNPTSSGGGGFLPASTLRYGLSTEGLTYSGGTVTSWASASAKPWMLGTVAGSPTYDDTAFGGTGGVSLRNSKAMRYTPAAPLSGDFTVILRMDHISSGNNPIWRGNAGSIFAITYAGSVYINAGSASDTEFAFPNGIRTLAIRRTAGVLNVFIDGVKQAAQPDDHLDDLDVYTLSGNTYNMDFFAPEAMTDEQIAAFLISIP